VPQLALVPRRLWPFHIYTGVTDLHHSFSFTLSTVSQMVSSSFDPFLPTAAELAGDAPTDDPHNVQPSERQACHMLARRALPAHQNNTKGPLPTKLESPPLNPLRMSNQDMNQVLISRRHSAAPTNLNISYLFSPKSQTVNPS